MKRKGFTLIELISAVAIMAILSTIVVTIVSKKINTVKDEAYETMITSIKLATEDYVTNNEGALSSYAENDWINIPLSTLIEEGYFSDSMEDLTGENVISVTNDIYVTRNYNGTVTSYYDENQNTNPTIELNGKYNVYIKKGENFIDSGAIATTSSGVDVSG